MQQTIQKTQYVLKKNGIIIFTDYLNYKTFEEHRKKVASFGLPIIHEEYLNDRLWFQVKSWLKMASNSSMVKDFLASEKVAQQLAAISAWRGAKGSKHLCFVAQKQA